MSKNTYFHTRFWQDSYVCDLDPSEKLIFIYALTSPYLGLTGIYEVPLKYIAVETGIEKDMVAKILKRFQDDKKIIYHEGWLCVVKYPRYQSFKGEPLLKAVNKEISAIPKDILEYMIGYGYPIDTLSIGYMVMERVMDMEVVMEEPEKEKKETSLSFLKALPTDVTQDLSEKYHISPKGIQSKATDLLLYCKQKGKVYKDYKAFLENALRKDKAKLQTDFPLVVKQQTQEEVELTPVQIEKNRVMRQQIADMLKKKKA